jgi:hypothetical protein
MATLWVREYSRAARVPYFATDNGGEMMSMPQEPGTDQTPVTFTTSAQSAAFGVNTRFIAIVGSAAFHYVVGDNPTATTNAIPIPASTPVFVGVTSGQRIAAVTAS